MTLLIVTLIAALTMFGSARTVVAASECQGAKIGAVAKKASCRLKLYAKQVAKGQPLDTAKLAACGEKMSDAFAKAQSGDDCTTNADAAAIEQKVDDFITDVVGSLDVPATATTTTTSTTVVCVTTTGAFTLCGRMCGSSARCPAGQTCSDASAGCSCVGDPIPCGDARLGVQCMYGDCPTGFDCRGPAECAGSVGLPCTCQPVP